MSYTFSRFFFDKSRDNERVMQRWGAASRKLSEGWFTAAVQEWSDTMDLQRDRVRIHGLPINTRFLQGVNWTVGFGHIALLDGIAKAHVLGMTGKQHHVVLAPPETISNSAYLDCLSHWLRVNHSDNVAPYLNGAKPHGADVHLMSDYPAVIEIGGKWRWLHDAMTLVEHKWQLEGRSPLPRLSSEQIEQGWKKLESWGISRNSWFVALHVRDVGLVSGGNEMDSLRNAEIATYQQAIRRVNEAGGHVVKIGSRTKTPDGLLDVFLLSQARFMIATNSGPAWVAGSFGTPVLLTNWAPIGIKYHYPNVIMLPKRLWSRKENRLLTEDEHNEEPYAFLESASALAKHDILQVPNSPEEIAAGVVAMLATFHSQVSTA
jgi:putative glycosyltransferase (TIGR04372 family)